MSGKLKFNGSKQDGSLQDRNPPFGKELCELPPMPVPPPCRVEYHSPFGSLMFASMQELEIWKEEALWKKLLGLTAYQKRLEEQRCSK